MDPKEYWNGKHPKKPVLYDGRGIKKYAKNIPIDVTHMVWGYDAQIGPMGQVCRLQRASFDETALACQQWVVRNIKYVSDDSSWGYVEYWQFPNETLFLKTGDCEDGSLLLATLLINCGIPEWRVRVNAGLVQQEPTAPEGGHAWVTYCRETDNNWVILDWCYFEDSSVPVVAKPLFKNVSTYKSIWFSFNNLYSWSQVQYEVINGIVDPPKPKIVAYGT